MIDVKRKIKTLSDKLSYTQILALGFLVIIFIGTVLLCLPVSSRSKDSTPFINSLFTATSATCVTGLTVTDTAMHWSLFGQIVIIFLIQIGGLGFMSVITMIFLFLKKQMSLRERRLLMQSAGSDSSDLMSVLIKKILLGTLLFEGSGIILLAFFFCPKLGFFKGMWYAVFHSVSAFCNAGFDLMTPLASASFKSYSGNIYVNTVLMLLIVIGGIGFVVWNDIFKNKLRFSRYELHTKLVLSVSALLIFGGALLYFIFERDHTLADMGLSQRITASLFQSVSARTAGFYTVDLSSMSEAGNLLIILLMAVGGSPGSTAGGLKTTTAAVVVFMLVRSVASNTDVVFFRRRIPEDTVRQACTIATVYLMIILLGTTAILAIEPCTLRQCLFEVVSAVNTVGSTQSLTSTLSDTSKLMVVLLMYTGRIGGMSLVLTFTAKRNKLPLNRPSGKILIG